MASLTTAERNRLPSSDFGIPSKRAYPIENKAHARAALARASKYASPSQQKQIRERVHRKYPSIKIKRLKV